ncbi:MAG: tetratricopeptide repeat protein [Thermodesulfobacteriota bacterium]
MYSISEQPIILKREDLISMEGLLYKTLRKFFPDMSFSLFFPRRCPENMLQDGQYIPLREKDRLLLPLVQNGKLLGMIVARSTNGMQDLPDKKFLSPILELCLNNLSLRKAGETDPLTGLYTKNYFLKIMAREIEQICSGLDSGTNAWPENGFKATFTIIIVDLDNLRHINSKYGFSLGDEALLKTAQCIKAHAPEHAVIGRLDGDDALVLLLSNSNSRTGKSLSQEIISKIPELEIFTPLTHDRLFLSASIGMASFPQDIKGLKDGKGPADISRNVLEKAKIALGYASRKSGAYCAFKQIVQSGGQIKEILPLGRVMINIGKFAGATEGQRFLVYSNKYGPGNGPRETNQDNKPDLPKAEIVLVDVQGQEAMAEILQLNDPAWTIICGDTLEMLPQDREFLVKNRVGEKICKDPLTGLHTLRSFLHLWDTLKNDFSRFSVILIRIGNGIATDKSAYKENQYIKQLAANVRNILPENALGGRYGSTSLIYFIPECATEELFLKCSRLNEICEQELQLQLCIGIAHYPLLEYSKSATIQNTRKALEHSLMLPPPRIVDLDSISFNISADRLFAEGDLFSAIEEYKISLTLDENNHLARNSLGICYARMGMLQEANACFKQTVSKSPRDTMAWYNLGCSFVRLNEHQEAEQAFKKALELDPGQIYCLFRLGLLYEKQDNLEQAKKYYQKAGENTQGQTMAMRHMGRIAFKQNKLEEARELLHQTLVAYPRDAHSLHLLARIYLKSGDDPEMAEILARQSSSLDPEQKEYIATLNEALEMQGKEK